MEDRKVIGEFLFLPLGIALRVRLLAPFQFEDCRGQIGPRLNQHPCEERRAGQSIKNCKVWWSKLMGVFGRMPVRTLRHRWLGKFQPPRQGEQLRVNLFTALKFRADSPWPNRCAE